MKLKAPVNRSDARTVRHALEQLSAKGSVRRADDEFVVEAEMEGAGVAADTGNVHAPTILLRGLVPQQPSPGCRPSLSAGQAPRARSMTDIAMLQQLPLAFAF